MKKKSIIFIIPRDPFPPFSGFAKHCFFIAKYLKKSGYKVVLISLNFNLFKNFRRDFPDSPFDSHHRLKLNIFDCFFILLSTFSSIFKSKPIQLSFFDSPFLKNKFRSSLKNIIKENNISFIHIFSIRTIKLWPILEDFRIPFFVDLIDSVGLTFQRYAKNALFPFSLIYNFEAFTLKIIESSMPNFKNLRAYSLVSRIDSDRIKINDCFTNKKYLYPIGIEFYSQEKNLTSLDKDYVYDLIFFGSLNYKPNLTAICWFIKEVMPLLVKNNPKIKLLVTGSNPPFYLVNLIKRCTNIQLIKNPKEIEPLIKISKISLAPMLTGSGQQNKVIESMAFGVPVVLSNKASEPLNLTHMKNCFIAENSLDYLTGIKLLLENAPLREKIGLESLNFVCQNHKWESIVSNLVKDIYEI